jgi:hypothetical protein
MIYYNETFAHDFAPNESAQFLALMQFLESEVNLVNQNLQSNNSQLAEAHAVAAIDALTPAVIREIAERNERLANDLKTALDEQHQFVLSNKNSTIDDSTLDLRMEEISAIIGETVTARIDPDQFDNKTTQALSFANTVDRILKSYGDAYDVGFDLTDMSQMANMGMHMMGNDTSSSSSGMGMHMMGNDTSSSSSGMGMHMMGNDTSSSSSGMGMHMMGMQDTMANTNDAYKGIANITGYQTAGALAERAIEIFRTELKPLVEGTDKTNMTSNLEKALVELRDSIENKASPMDVMMIVHTKVHPNILTIFDLPLASSPS